MTVFARRLIMMYCQQYAEEAPELHPFAVHRCGCE